MDRTQCLDELLAIFFTHSVKSARGFMLATLNHDVDIIRRFITRLSCITDCFIPALVGIGRSLKSWLVIPVCLNPAGIPHCLLVFLPDFPRFLSLCAPCNVSCVVFSLPDIAIDTRNRRICAIYSCWHYNSILDAKTIFK